MLSADPKRLARTLHHLRRRIGRGDLDRIPAWSKARIIDCLVALVRGHASDRIKILAIRAIFAAIQRNEVMNDPEQPQEVS